MSREQFTKEDMCGVRCWYLHQNYLHHVNGAGQRHLRVIMHSSGHACMMQASPAMNLSPVNVRRVALGSAGAKKLP